MNNLSAIILAAGEGKRMKSKNSKVLHKISDKPMIEVIYKALISENIDDIILVVGHKKEQVQEYMGSRVSYAIQEEQLGTGHAVMQAEKHFKDRDGQVFVLCGDTPLITQETLKKCYEYHLKNGYSATVITADIHNPTGYGRVIRDGNGNFLKIVEQKDATEQEKSVKEINSGMYCFDSKKLFDALKKINNNNNQGEYYLTDTLEALLKDGFRVGALKIEDNTEIMGINSRQQLAEAQNVMNKRICNKHMANGVTIIDPNNTYISLDAIIGMDTIIYPGTIIEGNTVIGEDCVIGPDTTITDSNILNGVVIKNSIVVESQVGNDTKIGPFAHVRPGNTIGNNVKVGDFIDMKKSKIGDGTKVPHLSYVGDAEIGANVNIGGGTIFVNYDGVNKFKTTVGDNAFVGSNNSLIAPVEIKQNGYTAAGSTITEEVPEYALAIARCRQSNIEDWVKNRK